MTDGNGYSGIALGVDTAAEPIVFDEPVYRDGKYKGGKVLHGKGIPPWYFKDSGNVRAYMWISDLIHYIHLLGRPDETQKRSYKTGLLADIVIAYARSIGESDEGDEVMDGFFEWVRPIVKEREVVRLEKIAEKDRAQLSREMSEQVMGLDG